MSKIFLSPLLTRRPDSLMETQTRKHTFTLQWTSCSEKKKKKHWIMCFSSNGVPCQERYLREGSTREESGRLQLKGLGGVTWAGQRGKWTHGDESTQLWSSVFSLLDCSVASHWSSARILLTEDTVMSQPARFQILSAQWLLSFSGFAWGRRELPVRWVETSLPPH